MLLLTTALLYCQYEENRQQAMRHLGLLCCFVTLMFFASPLATIRNVFNARSTDSLPFPIIFATFIVCIQWLFYGILLGDKFIQVQLQMCHNSEITIYLYLLSILDSKFLGVPTFWFSTKPVLYFSREALSS